MNSNNYNIKIATILPYKENYTFTKASAASLWVSEFFKKSKYKKNNIIFIWCLVGYGNYHFSFRRVWT